MLALLTVQNVCSTYWCEMETPLYPGRLLALVQSPAQHQQNSKLDFKLDTGEQKKVLWLTERQTLRLTSESGWVSMESCIWLLTIWDSPTFFDGPTFHVGPRLAFCPRSCHLFQHENQNKLTLKGDKAIHWLHIFHLLVCLPYLKVICYFYTFYTSLNAWIFTCGGVVTIVNAERKNMLEISLDFSKTTFYSASERNSM